ncbi:MAG TPA: hypothetical protein VJ599_01965 [Nitrososphaeraceae archaeon]|nr:hypothetical protein [Nitrososphaeraceae archaeon]
MTSEGPRQWKDLIDESVHTSDDIDIGDIEAQRKNIFVKCTTCGHSLRYHVKDKTANTYCEKCNCNMFT